MNKYRITLFTLALVGLLISLYLLNAYVFGGPIVCSGHGCETVRASIYASFFGIPTPAYGVLFYVVLIGSALAMGERVSTRLQWIVLGVTSIGVAVSVYLTYLEAFVINAWCLWCVGSALVTALAWLLVMGHTTLPKTPPHDTVKEL